jgi:osmoprotectant transport system ATP-binding protein
VIELINVTKTFPGSDSPAVDNLSIEIKNGEIVILVGPSGCGKTTTLKMINRLIEPTSGTITISGEPVDTVPAHQLRRGIGYVIQQVGLFPHKTVGENIATVPELLDWSKEDITARLNQLADAVQLDPEFLDRYPSELSGGQQQRVGVARALAADPPILLMDEPFAAVDPIVRAHLQDELLDLQDRVHKTIVIVTHDIDEAIKLGDRIAILSDGGHLEQYAPPSEILRDPANLFVANFLGTDRGIKRLSLIPVSAVDLVQGPVVRRGASVAETTEAMAAYDTDWFAVGEGTQLDGWAHAAELGPEGVEGVTLEPFRTWLSPESTLKDALDAVVSSHTSVAAIFDDEKFLGMVTADAISDEILR